MKTLIAIPCLDMVPVEFMTSLINLRKPEGTSYAVQANCMIYDSRNNLAAKALMNGYDRVLWLDSDMVFEPDLLERLSGVMEKQNLDYVTGLCFKRHIPTGPCIYRDIVNEMGENGSVRTEAIAYEDYPQDSLFEVAGSGFAAVLVKTELLKVVWEKYGPPFNPMVQMGEDLSFCWRARQCGYKIIVDPAVELGHIAHITVNRTFYESTKQYKEGAE